VPLALYVDWKNLYKRPATPGERLRGEEPITQFGRMCGKLGIELIAASSPQAKGRVERVHGTHQDRLVKKLRRKWIVSHEAANVYLQSEYLAEHNRRFARVAARKEDYHRRAPRAAELDRILRLETERTVSEDWVVRYGNRFLQLEPQRRNYAPARSKVLVCEGRYGSMAIEYRGCPLYWREIAAPAHADFRQETEVGTAGKPSVVSSGPPRGAEASLPVGRHRVARVVDLVLRFALNAPPCGLRRATLRTRSTKQGNAVGRSRCGSSFLEFPDVNFFEENHLGNEKRDRTKKGHF
jgi:hypothetical protein